jgi:CelD/BcsL family acetyltransferase involved in cellulose biosynthesis
LSELPSVTEPWRALAARALEPNVFYEPAFAHAAIPVFGHAAGAVLVWADATRRQLTGFFPARVANWRAGFLLPVTLGWTHPYAPLGTPLVDRDHAVAALGAWLDFVARETSLPSRILLPYVPTEGPFAQALAAALAARGTASARFAEHRRALRAPAEKRAGYVDRALSAKKRGELARQRRRLADAGEVATGIVTAPGAIAAALEAFMALEQSGWKGRGGTAAAQDDAVSRFMRQAVIGLAETGQASVVRFSVAGRAVAAGILLRSGAAGWFWKIAYDEDAARASPGVQLAVDLTQAALDDPTLAYIDSCATAGHPMIDPLWRERLTLADHLIVLGGSAAFAGAAESLRRRVFDAARKLRNRLRRP